MKKLDMHIHAANTPADPAGLLERMAKAGIYGGCIFSNRPVQGYGSRGTTFDERLAEVRAWTEGYEDRLFPVMWIHPYEDGIIENIHKAVEQGIAAFKVCCYDFYVYEDQSMKVNAEIAALNKPIIFHTGIDWSGTPNSQYSKPLAWEPLLDIPGLRFSMGHCSWPWHDECIALYGKFLHALTLNPNRAEMFFDITPGTPLIYREELLTKLLTVGYDVPDNILFGTDGSAHKYNYEWTSKWLKADSDILDRLGADKELRQKLYYDNVLRFLGLKEKEFTHISPACDGFVPGLRGYPEMTVDNELLRSWYTRLSFPSRYDAAFEALLGNGKTAVNTEFGDDPQANVLTALYKCERLEKEYRRLGIGEPILLDTLSDVVIWVDTWYSLTNELGLMEVGWLAHHFAAKLFRLGRLQFCMGVSHHAIPEAGVAEGDPVMEVHIPAGGAMQLEDCKTSIAAARLFFAEHFPDFHYTAFTCHSWLLDGTLKQFLSETSNIIKFQSLFTVAHDDRSDAMLKYIFRWDATREKVAEYEPQSKLAAAIKPYILDGGAVYESLGWFK